MKFTAFYWRAFNVAMRCMGIWWLIGGLHFIVFSITEALSPVRTSSNFLVNSIVDPAVIGAFVIVCAVLFLRVKAYRPDIPQATGRRSWWTGEPIENHPSAV